MKQGKPRLHDPIAGLSPKLVERYEQQVAYILDALGDIDEDFKYSLVSDLSKFSDFSLSKSELQEVSLRVGLAIVSTTLIAQAAKEMFEKKLDYVPSS